MFTSTFIRQLKLSTEWPQEQRSKTCDLRGQGIIWACDAVAAKMPDEWPDEQAASLTEQPFCMPSAVDAACLFHSNPAHSVSVPRTLRKEAETIENRWELADRQRSLQH